MESTEKKYGTSDRKLLEQLKDLKEQLRRDKQAFDGFPQVRPPQKAEKAS